MLFEMGNKTVVIAACLLINNDDSSSNSSSKDKNKNIFSLNTELEILYLILMVQETRGEIIATEKLTDYVEQVISSYSRTVFKKHFR